MRFSSLAGVIAALLTAVLLASCTASAPAADPESTADTAVERESATETETVTETEAETEPETIDGMRVAFTDAMDAYEKFVDKYAVFMRNYNETGRGDISLLSDFLKFMSSLDTEKAKFAAWQEDGLNDAEAARYADTAAKTDAILAEFEGIEA